MHKTPGSGYPDWRIANRVLLLMLVSDRNGLPKWAANKTGSTLALRWQSASWMQAIAARSPHDLRAVVKHG
eukprot:351722-Chlamydomonas_euryale.AAC.2